MTELFINWLLLVRELVFLLPPPPQAVKHKLKINNHSGRKIKLGDLIFIKTPDKNLKRKSPAVQGFYLRMIRGQQR